MKIRKAKPSDKEAIEGLMKTHSEESSGQKWMPVGMLLSEWEKLNGGWGGIALEGMILNTKRGVFGVGMIGCWHIGFKQENGEVGGANVDGLQNQILEEDFIIEYRDPPGVTRDENGKLLDYPHKGDDEYWENY